MRKSLSIVLLCCFLCTSVTASYVAPERFIRYGMQNGLANNIVFDITQDDNGYIWCATEEGLSRFDGTTFINYQWSLGNRSGQSNHVALRILCDENLVYVATHFGLLCYDTDYHRYSYLEHIAGMEAVQGCQVRAVVKSKDGGIWIGSYGRGIYYYDREAQQCRRVNCRLSDDRVLSLCEGDDGILYVGTHFGGLNIVDIKSGLVTYCNVENGRLSDNQIETLYRDSSGCLWIGTWNGLWQLPQQTAYPVLCDEPKLQFAKINALSQDADGSLWVGTEDFLCCLSKGGVAARYYHESTSGTGLSYKTIRDVFSDAENNVWVGTYGYGLNFINKAKQHFNYITDDAARGLGLPYKRVASLCEDVDGTVWVATDGGGVAHWDLSRHVFDCPNLGLSDDAVLSSLVDSDGGLWMGTYNCVLHYRARGASRFIQFKHEPNNPYSLVHSDITCLHEDSLHRIWVGQRAGLSYYDKSSGRFVSVEPLRWIHITSFCEYGNSLIVSTLDGVFKCDFTLGQVALLSERFKGVPVNTVACDGEGRLWLGTDGQGLWEYAPQNDSLYVYNEQNGLVSSVVQAIVVEDSSVWFTTNRSISKIEPASRTIENYSSSDGVQPGMFLRNSGTRLRSGEIIFGGTEGLNIFNPSDIKKEIMPVSLVFTNFLLFNQRVDVCSEENIDSPLEQDINSVDKIVLDYDESVFTIEYLGIDYTSPEKINYAYRLDGIDTEWNYVKGTRSVTYRNLFPGTYTFRVMASATDGSFEPSTQRVLTIVVEPPFYLTWWAYMVYFILFLVALYGVWYLVTMRMRVVSRINSERLQKQKQEELYQEKLQFFTNVSHELKTPLTLILAPLDKLFDEETDGQKRHLLSIIKKNAVRVIKNVNDIIDLRKIDRGQLKLRVDKVDVVPLLSEIVSSFEYVSREKNINLMFNAEQEKLEGWLCWSFVDKIVYNIVSNAFKFTDDYGEIVITLSTDMKGADRKLKIEIADTGIGMEQTDVSRIFERFYQAKSRSRNQVFQGSGIGLHLVKELVALHRGTITVDSRVGVGTAFVIVLPFDYAAYSRTEMAAEGQVQEDTRYRLLVNESLQSDDSVVAESSTDADNRYKILIAEDEADIRHFIATDLGKEYEVYEASNGEEAWEMALQHSPDLIISDIIMPEMNGLELCNRVKGDINTSHIPVILLTARDTHEDRLEGLEVGADSYIPKPFDIRHLRIRITRLIQSREQMKEKFMKKISLVPVVADGAGEEAPVLSPDELLMQKITQYIKEHLSDSSLNGESIADHVAMSRMNLHRKLKTLVGLSAGDLIRTIRLETAKMQLEHTSKTITEISYDTGFSSPSYFYICFNKKYGVSPSEYRNGMKSEPEA